MASITAPDYVERVLILGKNGTGKSELTYALEDAGNYRQVIYCDFKGDCEPRPPFRLITRGDDWNGWHARRIVYRPAVGSHWRSDAGWAQVLQRFFSEAIKSYDRKRRVSRKPRVVIIPEILLFGPRAQAVIGEIASGARAYELGLWIETQRPRRIPVVIRSEAWRIYIFPLGYEDDELEVLKYAKGRLSLAQLREGDDDPRNHSFFELVLRSKEGAGISVRRCPPLPDPRLSTPQVTRG